MYFDLFERVAGLEETVALLQKQVQLLLAVQETRCLSGMRAAQDELAIVQASILNKAAATPASN